MAVGHTAFTFLRCGNMTSINHNHVFLFLRWQCMTRCCCRLELIRIIIVCIFRTVEKAPRNPNEAMASTSAEHQHRINLNSQVLRCREINGTNTFESILIKVPTLGQRFLTTFTVTTSLGNLLPVFINSQTLPLVQR